MDGWRFGFRRAPAVALLPVLLAAPPVHSGPDDEAPAAIRRPWHDEYSEHQAPPHRSLDILSYRIAVEIDFERREIRGEVSVQGQAFSVAVSTVVLHAGEMEIRGVRGPDGEAIPFRHHGEELRLELPRPLAPGERTSFSVTYRARPRRGLYFVGPTEKEPDKPVQAWTQGEAEDTRYWLPVFDSPNERATTSISITVPEQFTAISNGELLQVEEGPSPGRRTYVWSMDFPHVGYLISLAVGDFEEIRQEWDGIPISHYVPPGRREEGMRSFGRTPEMMEFFSTYIGVRYPYPKYSQVAVSDFMYGGMENISATTQTVETLHEARNHLDYPSEGLVAHELAHQWWGDYVTCNSWAHAWLNEGFATYFEALFVEHDSGRDELDLRLRAHRKRYLEEDAKARRPLVLHRYGAPMDLFDAVLYQKGAWVLHMIRSELGDDGFRAAMQHHARSHAGRSVESADLRRSLAEATGRDLTEFFRQWVYGEGHPELYVTHRWQPDPGEVRVTVRQEQEGAAPFRLPLTIEIVGEEGVRRHRTIVHAREQEIVLPASAPPRLVLIDPDEVVLKTLEHKKETSEWILQLEIGPRAINRIDAAEALGGGEAGPAAVSALEQALGQDAFHGVRRAAARALGRIGTAGARDALLAGVSQGDSRVRTAVLKALGRFPEDEAVGDALRKAIRAEPADAPRAAALEALARSQRDLALDDLVDTLSRGSHREVVRASALKGLARIGGDKALKTVLAWTTWKHPKRARVAAVEALGKWPETPRSVIERLVELTRDEWLFVRREAARSIGRLAADEGIPALERLAEHDLHPRVRLAARRSLQALRGGGVPETARPSP